MITNEWCNQDQHSTVDILDPVVRGITAMLVIIIMQVNPYTNSGADSVNN